MIWDGTVPREGISINNSVLKQIIVPVIFLLLGTGLGFVAGQLKDCLDSRRTKKSFLKAIRVELSTLQIHLQGTLNDVTDVKNSLQQKTGRKALYLTTAFQTGVYTSQLGRLRDVADPIVLDVIRLYDQLSNLERVKAHVTSRSFELAVLTGSNADIEKENPIAFDYASSLEEIIKRINKLTPAASVLISKLPD